MLHFLLKCRWLQAFSLVKLFINDYFSMYDLAPLKKSCICSKDAFLCCRSSLGSIFIGRLVTSRLTNLSANDVNLFSRFLRFIRSPDYVFVITQFCVKMC